VYVQLDVINYSSSLVSYERPNGFSCTLFNQQTQDRSCAADTGGSPCEKVVSMPLERLLNAS